MAAYFELHGSLMIALFALALLGIGMLAYLESEPMPMTKPTLIWIGLFSVWMTASSLQSFEYQNDLQTALRMESASKVLGRPLPGDLGKWMKSRRDPLYELGVDDSDYLSASTSLPYMIDNLVEHDRLTALAESCFSGRKEELNTVLGTYPIDGRALTAVWQKHVLVFNPEKACSTHKVLLESGLSHGSIQDLAVIWN